MLNQPSRSRLNELNELNYPSRGWCVCVTYVTDVLGLLVTSYYTHMLINPRRPRWFAKGTETGSVIPVFRYYPSPANVRQSSRIVYRVYRALRVK